MNNTDHDQVVAHEIGHLMVGQGHPDSYSLSRPEDGGNAPLQSLPIEERKKRRMCTAERTGHLLVKTEWDLAEEWLHEFPDKRENANSN